MDRQFTTLTLQFGGYDEELMAEIHTQLREILAAWRMQVTFGDLRVVYHNTKLDPDRDSGYLTENDLWAD